jgi:hypothetical protein
MTEEQFRAVLRVVFIDPTNVEAEVYIDDAQPNHQAKWSFPESRLYVSRAVKTLLLDPESLPMVFDRLAIDWEPEFIW